MTKLQEFDAVNIKETEMHQTKDKNKKIRYLFEIDDREKALACYRFFNDYYQKVRQSKGYNKNQNKEDK